MRLPLRFRRGLEPAGCVAGARARLRGESGAAPGSDSPVRHWRVLGAAMCALHASCADDAVDPDGTTTSGGDGGQTGAGGAGGQGTNVTTGDGGGSGQALIDALDGTVWSALLDRDGRERAYELSFLAQGKRWAEVRNPFGPAREHRFGEFVALSDGETIQAVDDATGEIHEWRLTILDSSPRTLEVEDGAVVEYFVEGAWPEPQVGLTAEVRVFQSSGMVADAYCKSSGTFCTQAWDTMFEFARGGGTEQDLGYDIVAGANLQSWYNVPNFAVTDVGGFDFQNLGGTELSDQYNFFVRYTGWIDNTQGGAGGDFYMREQDDDVGQGSPTDYGGVWVFLGADVGSGSYDELFLGVNAFSLCFDGSGDEPGATSGPGFVPVEIIMIRCNTDGPPVDVELRFGASGPWLPVGDQPTAPDTSEALFPPALP